MHGYTRYRYCLLPGATVSVIIYFLHPRWSPSRCILLYLLACQALLTSHLSCFPLGVSRLLSLFAYSKRMMKLAFHEINLWITVNWLRLNLFKFEVIKPLFLCGEWRRREKVGVCVCVGGGHLEQILHKFSLEINTLLKTTYRPFSLYS